MISSSAAVIRAKAGIQTSSSDVREAVLDFPLCANDAVGEEALV
jgi:hypothetical protein